MELKPHKQSAAHAVRVHQPQITEAERTKRLEAIRRAAAALVIASERIEAAEKSFTGSPHAHL